MALPSKYDHLKTPLEIHTYYVREAQLDAESERDFFADDYVHHTHAPWQAPDFSGVLQGNAQWESAISELELEVVLITGAGDLIATHKVITGVHTGEGLGATPTGRRVRIPIMDFTRYRDRQIAEHWHVADFSELHPTD
jgi:predicted ester cyclase